MTMKLAFHATELWSEMLTFRVRRGRGIHSWEAHRWTGRDFELVADDCKTCEEAIDACDAYQTALRAQPDNDVEF